MEQILWRTVLLGLPKTDEPNDQTLGKTDLLKELGREAERLKTLQGALSLSTILVLQVHRLQEERYNYLFLIFILPRYFVSISVGHSVGAPMNGF